MKLKILFEDKDIIVCHKPAGVASQTERGYDPDMVSMLMNHLHENGCKSPYIGVIHRLDKPVSGVMIYAKNKTAAAALSKELADMSFSKKYYAIVMDNDAVLKDNGTLENYLLHDVRSNSSSVVDASTEGSKIAKLNYNVVSRASIDNITLALLDIELLTGRHHQIRVQLSHIGCPIVGDKKYGDGLNPLGRLKGVALSAYSLSFTHPTTKEKMNYEMKPDDKIWKQFL